MSDDSRLPRRHRMLVDIVDPGWAVEFSQPLKLGDLSSQQPRGPDGMQPGRNACELSDGFIPPASAGDAPAQAEAWSHTGLPLLDSAAT
eukprot:TRINITY_DN16014_c0_g2_i1.p2 TRINITY_DN16014_c0_g2~~TRINITY_DN16014_c0_g2_i1.p2  ORF type:complete len:104 (+),score=22.90 TRINITY_DN16014_c0_g2_i1:46-312(+)